MGLKTRKVANNCSSVLEAMSNNMRTLEHSSLTISLCTKTIWPVTQTCFYARVLEFSGFGVIFYQMYIGSVGREVDAIAGAVRRGGRPLGSTQAW